MDKTTATSLADRIIEELFTNGAGQKAQRLVLELENGRKSGGWSRGPVRDVIVRCLLAAQEKGDL